MKRILLISALSVALISCATNPGDKGFTPATAALAACEAYTVALNQVTALGKQGIVKEPALEIVDTTIEPATKFCGGNAPDVDAKVLDIAVMGFTATINTIIAAALGDK